MTRVLITSKRGGPEPQPTWDVAFLFPNQGCWSEEEYLALKTNRLVEFSNGTLEVLAVPTTLHQLIVAYLYGLLSAFNERHELGTVLFAPLRVQLWAGKIREPDIVFIRTEHAERIGNDCWRGADLVMEVVSDDPEDRERDLVTKRQEYARARIGEYWIVDPREESITVLRLAGTRYAVHGEFGTGKRATSHLLPGFSVDVAAALAQSPRRMSGSESKRKK